MLIWIQVPGGEQLTQNKMAILACGGGELLFFASAAEGSFARLKFRSFSENGVDATWYGLAHAVGIGKISFN